MTYKSICRAVGVAVAVLFFSVGCGSGGGAGDYKLKVSVNPANGGIVEIEPIAKSYPEWAKVEVSAKANSGFQFEGWSGEDTSKSRKVTITMSGKKNKTLTANFKVQPVLRDSRDGKIYKTVKIGTQTWMAENLNYEASGSVCYKNSADNCAKYGRLYTWETAKNACPTDWHLPGAAEWTMLEDAVGGRDIAGRKLKSTAGWNNDGNGTDDYGFSALPGGYGERGNRDRSFDFGNAGQNGYWWSTTEYGPFRASSPGMDYENDNVYWRNGVKNDNSGGWTPDLFSVRCVEASEAEKAETAAEEAETAKQIALAKRALKRLPKFTDSRDNKTYRKVRIGKQTWMAENLNYEAERSKCYEDKAGNCEKYGRLYNWSATDEACPTGWHLPTDEEWTMLENAVGGRDIAGKKLKATAGWNNGGNGTNEYGFSALPGGQGKYDGSFSYVGEYGGWWDVSDAYIFPNFRDMRDSSENVDRSSHDEDPLFSIRCVEDVSKAEKAKQIAAAKRALEQLPKFTDSRDNKTYRKVTIGKQTWMAENLNYKAEGSKCYEDKAGNCEKYGRLYEWSTAKMACPTGWHLPNDVEWTRLMDAVGDIDIAGKKLKSTAGWNNGGNGTNEYGFSALPGGYGDRDGSFSSAGESGGWWMMATQDGGSYRRTMEYSEKLVGGEFWGDTAALYSVRCVEDVSEAEKAKQIAAAEAEGKRALDQLSKQMVSVSGGTFTMGCTAEQGSNCENDEKPAHSITVGDFSISKYEVTQALWTAVMGENPSKFKGDGNLPVEYVSWNDVQEFIQKLNSMTGKKYRLPTEAEWEYAARGGKSGKGYKYSGSNNIDDVAWYDGNSGDKTKPVGTKAPNELGIYDMSGNVWEWVSDWYGSYNSSPATNPQGPSTGSIRVIRGGSWSGGAGICRVSMASTTTRTTGTAVWGSGWPCPPSSKVVRGA